VVVLANDCKIILSCNYFTVINIKHFSLSAPSSFDRHFFPTLFTFVFHTARPSLFPTRIALLETILRSANTNKLCTRSRCSPCRPLLQSSPSRLSSSSTYLPYLHHDFSSLRSGSRPRVPTKWAAPLARGTQLKVSHTGGHAAPRRDDDDDDGIDSFFVSFIIQIPRS